MALLEIKDLKFTYAGAAEPSLSGISFSVDHGEAVLLCGPVGCGKSTLISCLLPGGNPRGTTDGTVSFSGHAVGYVSQSEQVSVTDRVFSELSFPLENLGLEPSTILRRVSELAAALGLEKLLDRRINTLSGGERRLVSLGAALITRPELLLLDEPTSQLDPVTAARFYDSLFRISRDNGIALFICEHRTEEVIALCDRVIMLKDGTVKHADSPRALSSVETDAQLRGFLPLSARIAARLGTKVDLPLTVSEGRKFLGKMLKSRGACCENAAFEPPKSTEPALEMRDICFAYGRREPDVLCGLDLTLHKGEALCLLGGNGSGKSTALAVAAGLKRPYSGKCRVFGKNISDYKNGSLWQNCVALVPQNVRTLFVRETVREELSGIDTVELMGLDLSHLYDRHPYDLSGGEAHLLAIALALAAKPRLLLLDEPTQGVDPLSKAMLADLLRHLKSDSLAILAVTHDADFAPLFADRCVFISSGRAVADAPTREFFSVGDYYTTSAVKLSRGFVSGAVTEADLLSEVEK